MYMYKITHKTPTGETRTLLVDYIELNQETGDITYGFKNHKMLYILLKKFIIKIEVHKI